MCDESAELNLHLLDESLAAKNRNRVTLSVCGGQSDFWTLKVTFSPLVSFHFAGSLNHRGREVGGVFFYFLFFFQSNWFISCRVETTGAHF